MKILLPSLFGLFFYLGCGNNINPEIKVVNPVPIAPPAEVVLEDWDNPKNRKEYIQIVKESTNEGLMPEDYSYTKLVDFEEKYKDLSETEIEKYKELLSNSFTKYISHLSNGKLNPKDIYPDWEVKKNVVKTDSLLNLALSTNNIAEVIDNCKPKHNIYNYLKRGLSIIDSYPDDTLKAITIKGKLKKGAKSEKVVLIKQRLQYWKDLDAKDSLTPVYDNNMDEAIKKFQTRHGLEPDGIIGNGTINALNMNKRSRKEQIIANLERWRWFPRELGINHVVVNIPNYYLHTVQNKDTTRFFKVVVGTEKRRTPVLSSKIDNIIFNPTWTVPPTILKEDLIPGTQKNKKYITDRKITIFNRKGKEVSIGDWNLTSAEDYKYVQEPGKDNALGFVKINFPNKHAVYLHDTNHRELFVKNFRSLSSGCVRVENPLKLAEYLLYNKEIYTPAKIDSIIFFKKTKVVKIQEEIDVHILYFTAWYEKGQLQFRDDIYCYDTELYARLANKFRGNIESTSRVVNK
jgi:L,D-transpeptidase YcbB